FSFFSRSADHGDLHLSLHDALPISVRGARPIVGSRTPPEEEAQVHGLRRYRLSPQVVAAGSRRGSRRAKAESADPQPTRGVLPRSEEHTSELQSLTNLVCRLLLETK